MKPTGQNMKFIPCNGVNQPMFMIDTPTPKTGQFEAQQLWFPDSVIRRPLDIPNQFIDSFEP